jgi:hypothetical protein
MAELSKDDLDFLWTHLGELARAARTNDDHRVQDLITRLVAESDNPAAMTDACADAITRLSGYGHSIRSRSSTIRSEDQQASVDVGDIVQALAPPEWAGKHGFVVFIDPSSERFPIGVEFRLDNHVALWMFAADQLRHSYS